MRKLAVLAVICLLSFLLEDNKCYAQRFDTASAFRIPIVLDSFIVKSGFDTRAFIRRVQNDTTFYKAFKSLHLVPFSAVNTFTAFGKKGEVIASMHNQNKQLINKRGCRITQVTSQETTGDFLKKDGSYNYYTAELFFNLFYSDQWVCDQSDVVAGGLEMQGSSRLEKSKYELKQLMFNPGSRVRGVPFMGDRASLFEEAEAEKYNFSIRQEIFEGIDCYRFSITPKPDYIKKVVYNELVTWFRKDDYSIVGRDYELSYNTLLYDFNVRMKVRTKQIGHKLYPVTINYDGDWHVFTKKRERMKVTVDFKYDEL